MLNRPLVPLNDLGRLAAVQRAELVTLATRVVDSGWYLIGPELERFELALADFIGTRYAIGVASGTSALQIALTATEPRGAVLTAANAGGYTTTAAKLCGLEVRYADVDSDTHCLSPDAVEKAVATGQVGAVVVTHLYGRLADIEALVYICRSASIPLIEDCAQSIGAARKGRRAGSFGDVAAFSFYPTKNLGALGDGGAVATDDPDIAFRVKRLRQYGWSRKYEVEHVGGTNSRLDEFQAAVLSYRLPLLEQANARRREIVSAYVGATVNSAAVRVLAAEGMDHAAHLAVAVTGDRDAVRAALAENGVATDVHYPIPDHWQEAWKTDVSLPITERLAQSVVTLPCFPELSDDEIDQVAHALEQL